MLPEILSSAVLAAAITAFVSFLIARANRLKERPNSVNSLRHEREVWYLEQLSGYLLELWHWTDALEKNPSSERIEKKWSKVYMEAFRCLGRSAPFLNYLDLSRWPRNKLVGAEGEMPDESTGCCTCGVHFYTDEHRLGVFESLFRNHEDFDCSRGAKEDWSGILEESSGNSESSGRAELNHRKSLYLRAAEFLDLCMKKRQGALCGVDGSLSDRFDVLGDQYISIVGAECQKGDDASLREKYKKFINCAYCRMRYCEKGKKGARRSNRRAAWRKWRERWLPFVGCYNTKCPYDEQDI